MTVGALLTSCQKAGIVLAATGNELTVDAPKGVLTPDLLATLRARKPDVLAVLWRLDAMRATAGQTPVAVARPAVGGGPGRCFSCGDAFGAPTAYGRCTPCDVAADVYYAAVDEGPGTASAEGGR